MAIKEKYLQKLWKVLESKYFILFIAVAFSLYGFFRWSDFSDHVDKVAEKIKQSRTSDNLTKETKEIEMSFADIEKKVLGTNQDVMYCFVRKNKLLESRELEIKNSGLTYRIEIKSLVRGKSEITIVSGKSKPLPRQTADSVIDQFVDYISK